MLWQLIVMFVFVTCITINIFLKLKITCWYHNCEISHGCLILQEKYQYHLSWYSSNASAKCILQQENWAFFYHMHVLEALMFKKFPHLNSSIMVIHVYVSGEHMLTVMSFWWTTYNRLRCLRCRWWFKHEIVWTSL